MSIYNLLQDVAFDPERIEVVAKAFEDTLVLLQVADRKGPVADRIAKAVFAVAQRGERDPQKLQQAAVAELEGDATDLGVQVDPVPAEEARPTILIVEDDNSFAYAASRYLEKLGYRSVVADGSMAAFRELDRQSVDLVVADVQLGKNEPHGVALGRMIRNRNPKMPVLLVTAFPQLLDQEKPLPGQAFVKPVELRQLAEAVEASLSR